MTSQQTAETGFEYDRRVDLFSCGQTVHCTFVREAMLDWELRKLAYENGEFRFPATPSHLAVVGFLLFFEI